MGQKLIDEIGHRYGSLVVLSLTKDKDNRTAWLCQCDCGNVKIVRGPDLRKGKITSCGCGKNKREKRIVDLSGKTFGFLKVISRADEYYDYHSKKNVWKCKCLKCGQICYVKGGNLITGHTKSCGCSGMGYSLPVQHIALFLKSKQITFHQEQTFPDLLSNKGYPLRFDFCCTIKSKIYCIEYNGKQHYEAIEFFGGEKGLQYIQSHDQIKREYCKKKNIPLLTIDYSKNFDEIDQLLINFLYL